MQVHVLAAHNLGAVVDLIAQVKGHDDGEGEVGLEEALGAGLAAQRTVALGKGRDPKLRDEHQHVEEEADPGPDHARLRAEGELVQRVSLQPPALAEADVRQADGAPGEDRREAGQGEHPRKGLALLGRRGKEAQEAQHRGDADADYGAAPSVDVGQEARRLPLLGERRQGARRAVHGRVSDRENGDHDDDVHDRVKPTYAGVFDGDDERRS